MFIILYALDALIFIDSCTAAIHVVDTSETDSTGLVSYYMYINRTLDITSRLGYHISVYPDASVSIAHRRKLPLGLQYIYFKYVSIEK